MMGDNIHIWENSEGTMFISWEERHDSLFYPEPHHIETMARIINTTPEVIRNALEKWNKSK